MLALAGGRDHMIPIGVSRAMSRFYGSKLRYREQPECGHWLIGEAGYPERIAEIHSWLSAHGA